MLQYTAQAPIFDALLGLYTLPYRISHKASKQSFAIPNTDVLESKDAYKIVVQLPGVAKQNIAINFENNTITVSTNEQTVTSEKIDGEVSEELESQPEHSNVNENEVKPNTEEFKTHVKQIISKPYKKVLEFPSQVDYDNISADYSNGLLTLLLPKSAKTQKTIQIL